MSIPVGTTLAPSLGLVTLFALCVQHALADEPDNKLKPTYGSATLKAGFEPDPFSKNLVAGGRIATKLGGVSAQIGKAPDFRLQYTAGKYPLRFYVEAKGDTTLLVKLPDGTWIANDDGGAGRNPQLSFAKPQSGQYDIWVGTVAPKDVDATLRISEVSAPDPKKATTITLISLEWHEFLANHKIEMRVYQTGSRTEVFKGSRITKNLGTWELNRGPYQIPKAGMAIQFWEINSGIFEKDQMLAAFLPGPDGRPGVQTVTLAGGPDRAFRFTLKYRIDR